jgi:hypothetical protein
MKRFFAGLLTTLLLAGCSALTPAEPLSKAFYQKELHPAVCYAVEQVNAAGLLTNEAEFGPAFETAIGEYLAMHEIDSAAWIAARETHFTPEEHEKMLKLHFAWCVSGMEKLE